MKQEEIEVGAVYTAKVSGRLVSVKIKGKSPYGGWYGTNLMTGRTIRVDSALRLCERVHPSETAP